MASDDVSAVAYPTCDTTQLHGPSNPAAAAHLIQDAVGAQMHTTDRYTEVFLRHAPSEGDGAGVRSGPGC